jgi:hypothetical protein
MNKKVPFIDNSRQSPLWFARDDRQLFISDITRQGGSGARNYCFLSGMKFQDLLELIINSFSFLSEINMV